MVSLGFTLNDSQQYNDDEEEEADVEEDSKDLVLVTVWGCNLVADPSSSPNTFVQVEHETLKDRREDFSVIELVSYWYFQRLIPSTCRDTFGRGRSLPQRCRICERS